MKIGILTFHYAYNYGALMQAWALKEFLISKGHDVSFVNHKNKKIVESYCIYDAKYLKSDSKSAFFIKILLYPLKVILRLVKYKKFKLFIAKEFQINKKIDKVTKGMDITLKIIRGIFFAIIAIALLIYVLYVVGLKANSDSVGKIEDLYKVHELLR